jgi:hypothetical protein
MDPDVAALMGAESTLAYIILLSRSGNKCAMLGHQACGLQNLLSELVA